eukprot:6877676-Alexandrium_andersonii.AAC.1
MSDDGYLEPEPWEKDTAGHLFGVSFARAILSSSVDDRIPQLAPRPSRTVLCILVWRDPPIGTSALAT